MIITQTFYHGLQYSAFVVYSLLVPDVTWQHFKQKCSSACNILMITTHSLLFSVSATKVEKKEEKITFKKLELYLQKEC